jgi:hypothetical protein
MNRKRHKYTPRGALCSLRRLKLLLERIKKGRKNKTELIYGVFRGSSPKECFLVQPILYYIYLDAGTFINLNSSLHTIYRRDSKDGIENGTFDLKHWNVTARHQSRCFLFENYFFALAYKLNCEHDQQTSS